jgi:glutamate mutase epsilon subunit
MPVGSVSTAVPPQVSMALEALSSTLQAEQDVANVLLGGAPTGTGGASNPGPGQIVDISA